MTGRESANQKNQIEPMDNQTEWTNIDAHRSLGLKATLHFHLHRLEARRLSKFSC